METRTGVTMGTPYYMSPEQVEGKRAVDFRTDLWAMAVITSECMTGVRPFDGSTFGELLLNICARPIAPPSSQGLMLPGFDAWFAKATNRDAEQRFASAQELASTLGEVVRGAGGPAFAAPMPATALMPAPTPPGTIPGQGPYVPAATAGNFANPPHPATHSPSVNTAQALELSTRSTGRSALPWILLAVVVVLSAVGAAVLLLRPAPGAVAADPSASAAANAPAPTSSTPATLAPAPDTSPERDASANEPVAPRPPSGAQQTPVKPALEAPPAIAAAPLPVSPPATPTSAPATASKASRCFSDPFSGQIRQAGANRPANVTTFACVMDPFTGKYKKL
jgi:serine/threonine-protein kinase